MEMPWRLAVEFLSQSVLEQRISTFKHDELCYASAIPAYIQMEPDDRPEPPRLSNYIDTEETEDEDEISTVEDLANDSFFGGSVSKRI